MLETSARLLRLLAVLQARRFWAGSELARHLEVTPRTLRRDVDRLRGLGYAVEATSGPGGGYQLGKGRQMPPLMLEDEEAVALAVAVRAALDAFSGVEDAAMRALVKLEQLMPAGLRKRVGAFSSATLSLGRARVAVSADLLVGLAGACRDERKLSFEYTGHDRVGSTREVEPLRLVHSGHGPWYLVAWDLAREDWRTFRADPDPGSTSGGGALRAAPAAR
ncbi:MAG: WYL domain-containing protein [Deltaproteobacteria bacterium]|nr:WYL domain-containing protein [Deltaproteobacteria bacterium]